MTKPKAARTVRLINDLRYEIADITSRLEKVKTERNGLAEKTKVLTATMCTLSQQRQSLQEALDVYVPKPAAAPPRVMQPQPGCGCTDDEECEECCDKDDEDEDDDCGCLCPACYHADCGDPGSKHCHGDNCDEDSND